MQIFIMCYWYLQQICMVVPLKVKKGVTITNTFQNILDESNCKANKIWVYKGSEFYNRSTRSWLEKNTIDIYSTHNEGKSVNAKKFIITLKNKIYKYMTSISKNVYIDKLDDIVHKYNNTYHSTIRMKPIDVRSNSYIDSSKEINVYDSNIKTSQHKHILAKGYTTNWSEEVFV